jgi:hypothetical protein
MRLPDGPSAQPTAYPLIPPRVVCCRGPEVSGLNLALTLQVISTRGAQLAVWFPLEEGEEVLLLIRGAGQPRALRASAVVVQCRPTRCGTYRARVEFRPPLTRDAIRPLGEPCLRAAPPAEPAPCAASACGADGARPPGAVTVAGAAPGG